MLFRAGLTIASHLAKYGVLVLIDPTFVSVAVAATADSANAVSQGTENVVSTFWDIAHDLVMDAQTARDAEELARRIDAALGPIRKKYELHWAIAESQLIAITGRRIPSPVEFAQRLNDRNGKRLLASFEATYKNFVQFENDGQRQACEEALSAWLGVLATDAGTVRTIGLRLTTTSADTLARLEKALLARPDLRAEIERAMQACRDVEALRWLKVPVQKWKPRRDSSEILKADYAVVPLLGREADRRTIDQWLDSEWAIDIKAVTGIGGTGKTRLFQELVRDRQGTHLAGFISRGQDGRPGESELEALFQAAARLQKPVFAVVDYADTQSGLVGDLLTAADAAGARLRLALLTRHAVDWKERLQGRDRGHVGKHPAKFTLALAQVFVNRPERRQFFAKAVDAFAKAVGKPVPEGIEPEQSVLDDPDFGNALVLSIAALAYALGDRVTTQQQAFDWALGHERNGWRKLFAKDKRPEPEDAWLDCVAIIAAVATMTGGAANRATLKAIASQALGALQREDLFVDGLADALASLYPNGRGGAAALEPDRIGEFLVYGLLQRQFAPLAIASAIVKATGDAVPLLRFFNRVTDWLEILTPEVAKGLYNHLPEQTLEFRDLAERVTRAAMGADVSPEEEALHLNNLSVRLSDLGRREEALAAAQRAVELREELAASRPDAFRPDLAASLNNLANILSGLGRREGALAAAQRAADLYEELAASRRDAFRPYLATSLNNLANRLSSLGRREEALSAAQRAADLYGELAASRPDAFRPYLAASLNTLATMLSGLGRREEALAAAQRAVELSEELAKLRPDAFRPDLAMSLNNLANRLSDLGRREEALAAAQRAADLYEELAASRPDAFAHDLATSRAVLGVAMLGLGRAAESAASFSEALATLMPMLRRHPPAFAGLAMWIGQEYMKACAQAGIEPEAERLVEMFAILVEAGLVELPAQEG